ncbi:MAG: hypothetical protein HZA54_08890 [Planctomycetes bacterium]|nr:hypothetical protein [Planctomycetota bacterium]
MDTESGGVGGSAGATPEAARSALREARVRAGRQVMTGFAAAALGVLAARHGFVAAPRLDLLLEVAEAVLALAFLLYPAWKRLAGVPGRRVLVREAPGLALSALTALGLALFGQPARVPGVPIWAGLWRELEPVLPYYLLAHLVIRLVRLYGGLGGLRLRPVVLLVVSFASVIGLGTVTLCLPRAASDPARPLALVDAFFTATSATCVTGLSTVPIGSGCSRLGQTAILVLIQVGGLGIMTFAMLQSALVTRDFKLSQVAVLRDLLSQRSAVRVGRTLLWMTGITLAIEAAGAGVLYGAWVGIPEGERPWWAVFHAISAFCNAGFCLADANLLPHAGQMEVVFTVVVLLVAGGLGFSVLEELVARAGDAASRVGHLARRTASPPGPGRRLTVHTRVVLTASLLLAGCGALGYLALEGQASLAGLSWGEAAWAALFQALSARTAGFNTVPMEALSDAGILWLIGLMAVGASPASTGGGMKTVTVVVLLATLSAMLRGRESVDLCRRRVPRGLVNTAVAIVVAYLAGAFAVTLALAVTEPGVGLKRLAFEAVSALSTVGLTTGITPGLSVAGKLVVAAAMFAGRVGPLAILGLVARPAHGRAYEYPEEEVLVG